MQDATASSHHPPTAGYSLQEAAVLLGIGVNTLRRRIAAGQIQAEQIERPQGHVWRVYLDARHPPSQPANQPPEQEAAAPSQQPPTQLAQAEAISTLVQTTVAAVLGPLVAELAASRQQNEHQADQLVSQAETIGSLRAENDALRASQTKQDANPGPVEPEAITDAPVPLSARLRALGPWLLAVLAIVAVVVLLAWPR